MSGDNVLPRSPELGDAYLSPQIEDSTDLTGLLNANNLAQRSTEPTRMAEKSPLQQDSDWRVGAIYFAAAAFASLVLNIILAICIPTLDSFRLGVGVVWTGNCKRVGTYNTIIHLGINGISTMLLSGSNYCMQCLTAPTRKDLQLAHSKGIWLDIGVLSVRNLSNIGGPKAILWFLLGISSVPLHLIVANTEGLPARVADEEAPPANATEYLDDIKNTQSPLGSAMKEKFGNFEKLSSNECISKYAQDFITGRRTLISTASNATDEGPFAYGYQYLATRSFNVIVGEYRPYDWMCFGLSDFQNECYSSQDLKSSSYLWTPWYFPVKYCHSEIVEENCAVNASQPIILIIIVCYLVKLIIMTMMAFGFKEQPIVTLGDAIESFLDEPDSTTEGFCLLSADEYNPTAARRRRYRWSDAVSAKRWTSTLTALGIAILVVVVFLGVSVDAIKDNNTVAPFSTGFGSPNGAFLISSWAPSKSKRYGEQLLVVVIIANIPQILFSAITFCLNGILTIIYTAREWEHFSRHRKTLRVSEPRGEQRCTYFLQLPYRIGIPFSVACGLISWLLSLSISPILISNYDSWGSLMDDVHAATCGFSPSPMVAIIVVMLFLFASIVMPMVGTHSADISAACHHNGEQEEETGEDREWVGHCCFTSDLVKQLKPGLLYAGKDAKCKTG
ncbi:hypothetical protein B0J13DRAFT_579937 [Dactylonectria estremocensis]|uniref:DUF6536 domain-containing protein n=1 Tax=Dactylonectria estremocensis TaxID=1079267 RepID=A0A9P9FHQ3_9HYPO|nr:hypothetical protein B0J13DRAFT_579937 [Dactylonectria estremocensis]